LADNCGTCHDAAASTFQAAHGGIPAGKTGCTTCHDPHGSGKAGLLLAFSHKPYEDKSCEACHGIAGGLDSQPPALCVKCHDKHAGDASLPVPHAALSEGRACLNCHSPHAGKTKSLLVRDDLAATCKSCHDRAMFEGKVKHPEAACEPVTAA
jgi:predicted CXXCH cytochrome family protein